MSSSSRAVERMSQNVEELQWRIRNQWELPVEIRAGEPPPVPATTAAPQQRDSPQRYTQPHSSYDRGITHCRTNKSLFLKALVPTC